MNDLVEKMRVRIAQIADPEDPYTQEDFDKEFSASATISTDQDYWKIKLGFNNKSNNPDPEYATSGSSGFDFRANLSEPMIVKAGKRALVPTGLFFELPENFEIQVRSRSGLSIKHGVCVLNGIGTIDSDYTGEIGVILINHGENDFVINHGDRIAQGVLSSVVGKNLVKFVKIDSITRTTERGSGGYGSTGYK